MTVEVLFEYKDSKRKLTLIPEQVCETITEELANRFGIKNVVVYLSKPLSSNASFNPPEQFLLQKWSSTWQSFVDVEHTDEIEDRDRLTIVTMPGSSPQVCYDPPLSMSVSA